MKTSNKAQRSAGSTAAVQSVAATPAAAAATTPPAPVTRTLLQRIMHNGKPTVTAVPGQTTLSNGTITGSVLGTDPDNDVLTYKAGKPTKGGTVTIGDDGRYVYTPGANFASGGTDKFSVTVSDGPPLTLKSAGVFALFGLGRPLTATTTVTVVYKASTTPAPPGGTSSAATNYGWGTPNAALSDEFSGSGMPSQSVWDLYNSPGHNGNGLRRPGQITEQNGYVQIAGTSKGTTGGMMSTAVAPAYGRWEARMRVDDQGAGNPYHAVVALIPSGVPYNNGAGDLDFAEADVNADGAYVFVHYPSNKQAYASTPLDLSQWHTYSIEVAPDHISWFVDGKAQMTTTNKAQITGTKWTMNVQLDAFTPSGLAPSNMQVDYFRYYDLPASGAPIVPAPAPGVGTYL